MDSTSATLFRRYITELEYRSASYDLANDKITLLENKNILWEQTANNYKDQLTLTQGALDEQVVLQNQINKQIKEDLKTQKRKGLKTGSAIGAVVTLIVCLLVK